MGPFKGSLMAAFVCAVVLCAFVSSVDGAGLAKYCDMPGIKAKVKDGKSGEIFSMGPESACDANKYVNDTVRAGGVCFAIAIITLILSIGFCFGRCCNCCGGRKQHPGVCCVDKSVKKRYPVKSIAFTKLWFGIGAFLIIIALIVGPSSMGKTDKGSKNSINAVNIVRDDVISILDDVIQTTEAVDKKFAALKKAGMDGMPTVDVGVANGIRDTLSDFSTSSAETSRDKYMKLATLVCLLVFIVPVILVVISFILSVVLNKRKAPVYLCFCVFVLISLIIWILAGLHTIVGNVTRDLCAEVELAVTKSPDSIIRIAVPCDSIDFGDIENLIADVKVMAAETVCKVFSDPKTGICHTFPSDVSCDYSKMPADPKNCKNFTEVATYPQKFITVKDPYATTQKCAAGTLAPKCSLYDCGTTCTIPNNQSLAYIANITVGLIDAAREVEKLLDRSIRPLLGCDAILMRFLSPFNKPCKQLSGGVRGMASGYVLAGVGFVMVLFGLIFGTKRFIKWTKATDYESNKTPKEFLQNLFSGALFKQHSTTTGRQVTSKSTDVKPAPEELQPYPQHQAQPYPQPQQPPQNPLAISGPPHPSAPPPVSGAPEAGLNEVDVTDHTSN